MISQSLLNRSIRFIGLLCLIIATASITVISSHETVSAPPRFGDRIGKLKRISPTTLHSSTTITTTTTSTTSKPKTSTISPTISLNDVELNSIHRSDDYFTTEESSDNSDFLILKGKPFNNNNNNNNNSYNNNKNLNFNENENTEVDHNSASNVNNYPPTPSTEAKLVQARFEMVTDFFDVPPSPLSSVFSTPDRPTFSKSGVVLAAKNHLFPTNSTLLRGHAQVQTGLRADKWVVPILVLSCITMTMMGAFEIFVLCKTRRTSPNRRHLFLGQMLLLGLFSCVGLSALLVVRPTTLSCATIRLGAGVSFAIVFASLLVKCIFLISLNSGVYLPAPYQGLLLLFAVLIQITINVQWLVTKPAGITFFREFTSNNVNRLIFTAENLRDGLQLCNTSFLELRVSLIYIDFLIIIVAILAIKSRGIRDNYREATYIGLTVALIIPVWLGTTLVGLAVHDRYKDACIAFSLLVTPTIIFLVMFMPKGRQLAAMGREDLYMEEREERFSASSRAGSGYSPSFFHFKPIKYGVMSGKNGTTGTEFSGKNPIVATTLAGGELHINISTTILMMVKKKN
jgi:hypothetical protein